MLINDLLIDTKLDKYVKYLLAYILACDGFIPIGKTMLSKSMGINSKSLSKAFKGLEKAGIIIVSNKRSIEIDWDETERRFKCLLNSTEAQKTA